MTCEGEINLKKGPEKMKEEINGENVAEKILSIPRFTREKHDLSILRTYLDRMGNPERGIRVIHVAGTNGKGSVTRMLADLLRLCGARTGCFTSPHLIRMNERITVDGREIDDSELAGCYLRVEEVRDREGLPQLTFFEILFLIAMLHFAGTGVEYAVLETGLGGRLDATTAVPAELYVITQIGMDHEEYLGNTISRVAGEKAGIITGSSPLVYHTGDREADRVIEAKAREMGVRACLNCEEFRVENVGILTSGIDFSVRNDYDEYDHLFLPVRAGYQVDNAVTVIGAAGFLIPEKEKREKLLRKTFSAFSWNARFTEVLPGVYLDGAHNPSAAERLAETVQETVKAMACPEQKEASCPVRIRKRLVFGASRDKDMDGVLSRLSGVGWDEVWLVPYSGERSAEVSRLEEGARAVLTEETVIRIWPGAEAVAEKLLEEIKTGSNTGENGEKQITVVAGSLYLAGEMLALFSDERLIK